jgi:hypothetical protein
MYAFVDVCTVAWASPGSKKSPNPLLIKAAPELINTTALLLVAPPVDDGDDYDDDDDSEAWIEPKAYLVEYVVPLVFVSIIFINRSDVVSVT